MPDDRDQHHDDPHQDPVRRPGPHGAEAEEAIARAYRRAERTTRKAFQEVEPRPVVAAEAVTALDEEYDEEPAPRGRLVSSRACFIATAAYGDADAPEVLELRRFRDEVLLQHFWGRAFVRTYYRMSPPFARIIARRPKLRVAVKKTLDFLRTRAAMW